MRRIAAWFLVLTLALAPAADALVQWTDFGSSSTLQGLSLTSKLFADGAQAEDVTITLSALGAGVGRYSARFDKGSAGPYPIRYYWSCHLALTGTNVVGSTVEFYVILSDGTNAQGELGTANAALVADKRRNLLPMGQLVVDQTTSDVLMTASGTVDIPTRYFSLGVWNGTTLPLKTDTAIHGCTFTPLLTDIR